MLLAAAFPPLDLGPLAFVALVPLLWAWRDASPRGAALWGLVFGLAFVGVVLEWSRYFGAVAIAPFVLLEAAFFVVLGALVGVFARHGIRSPWLVAAVWVVLEALRARFPWGGMPWGEVGVALHDLPSARALASVGGVPLVSFAVVAVNGLLLDLLIAVRKDRGGSAARRGIARAAGGIAALVVLTLVADLTRFEPRPIRDVRFAMLQGLDFDRNLTASEITSDFLARRHLELAERLEGRFDVIVFPESSLERDPEQYPDLRASLVTVARAHDAVVLVNARYLQSDGEIANANLAYDGKGRLLGVYAKQHLVPFGEYVPLRDALSFIGELRQVPYDFAAGDRRVQFSLPAKPGERRTTFGSVICFESAFAPLVRDYVRDGAGLIVVSTSNRTFRRSGLAAQHLALSQMRAAETGRPVLHASISGITGVIDPDGDVSDTSELFVNKVTTGTVQATEGETLYVRLGDWVLLAAGAALVLVAAWSTWWGWRRPSAVDSAQASDTKATRGVDS